MRALLEFVIRYVDFLYLNPAYRIVDSRHRGLPDIDASISFASGQMRWDVTNDRGQYDFTISPVKNPREGDYFWISMVRQYLDGGDDSRGALGELLGWVRENFERIEQLFADDETVVHTCDELIALKKANAYKNWGWPKPGSEGAQ